MTLAAHHVLLEREELDVEVQAEDLEGLRSDARAGGESVGVAHVLRGWG